MKKILVSSGLVAVLGAGTSAAGIASASAAVEPSARTTVPTTVLGHPGRVAYKVRPRTVVELEPFNRHVVDMEWLAWSSGGASGSGTLQQVGQRGGGVPCRVVLSRVRSGHFTRMQVTSQSSPHSPMKFQWSSARDDWR
jgi:hypothetical protein